MSSHHFVKEEQEPALIIMDTQGVSFELVQELLEWSPTVIVSESIVQQVLLWGIKIDVVIALAENIEELNKTLHDQIPIKFISCNTQEEQLSTALYFLIATKQKAVNIVSIQPLEIFETFDALNLSVIQFGKRWSLIQSGSFEKWVPKGTTLHVFPPNESFRLTAESDGVLTIHREGNFWVAET